MTDSTLNQTVNNSYVLNALTEKPKDFEPSKGFRLCRVIFKQGASNPTKALSQYCTLPELNESYIQSFMRTVAGKNAVAELIEGLQDAAVRAVWLKSKRSPCDADITIDAISAIAAAASESVRLTKENIISTFDAEWCNRIALSLAIERDEEAALIFTACDDAGNSAVNEESAAAYWNSEAGARMVAIASNYKQFFVAASERAPTFASDAIKSKVMLAVSFLDDSVLKVKLEEKLQSAPIASIDDSGL